MLNLAITYYLYPNGACDPVVDFDIIRTNQSIMDLETELILKYGCSVKIIGVSELSNEAYNILRNE